MCRALNEDEIDRKHETSKVTLSGGSIIKHKALYKTKVTIQDRNNHTHSVLEICS